MSEVLATIRAALRRRAGLAAPITANDVISLDPATREASCCDLHARLTGQEFSLLQALMVRSGAILPRSEFVCDVPICHV
jgi:two-component system OmpR family response regulator